MLRKVVISLSIVIILVLVFGVVYPNLRPAEEENTMTTNVERPLLDTSVPIVTETATFALG